MSADIMLECPSCEAFIDFSHSFKDSDRVVCGKCSYDIGTYANIKAKAKAFRNNAAGDSKSTNP